MKWLIGLGLALAVLAGLAWYAVLDGAAPEEAGEPFDLAAYRSLLVTDAPETLPSEVRVEFVGASDAPSFATEAGAFDGDVRMTYTAFQVVAAGGNTIIDGAVDAETAAEMNGADGDFCADCYGRVLEAVAQAAHVLITHEHLDHVMALARHPEPAAIAPRLRLTRAQLEGLAPHAPGGALAPAIEAAPTLDFSTPRRIAPGIVAHAAPGHTPGTIVIFVRTQAREYLFVGDIVWVMSSIQNLRGRPRFIRWAMPQVDPDRPAVLRQIRALYDLGEAEPDLVILPAHDDAYLRRRIAQGALTEGFAIN